MAILDLDRALAAGMYRVCVGRVAMLGNPEIRVLAEAALKAPGPLTIRALVNAGEGQPWLPGIRDALAEVGIAASTVILGDGQ